MLTFVGRETWTNSPPEQYVIDLSGVVRPRRVGSRSDVIVDALIARDQRIRKSRGFRRAVTNAIFDDAFHNEFGVEPCESKLYTRLAHRWGEQRARRILEAKIDTLATWQTCTFIPDAFLIQPENRTVVCYEVEDTNPLKAKPLLAYSFAWWALSEIWWDLHLIAYDIFGNHRIVSAAEVGFLTAAFGPSARLKPR